MRLEEARGIPSDKQIGSFFLFFHDKNLPPILLSHKQTSIRAAWFAMYLTPQTASVESKRMPLRPEGRIDGRHGIQYVRCLAPFNTAQQVLYSTLANPRI